MLDEGGANRFNNLPSDSNGDIGLRDNGLLDRLSLLLDDIDLLLSSESLHLSTIMGVLNTLGCMFSRNFVQ
jgi:hypothetical protein